ncbi:MAG: BamA/TamA family outer membrane protein [Ignavibacteriaceae bacterium]|nr:BamA/TamA family outer membrane protein [Ignavibacteriaceae bacterium]
MSFFVIVFSFISNAQTTDSKFSSELYPFIVDSIVVTGNETTETFIILRELNFKTGDTLTLHNAIYNRERIYSLGIFNQVYFEPAIRDSINILNIYVEESWYIYPIPFIDANESDLKKLSYGAYLRLKNFRGRNEDLMAMIALGYDPAFSLSFYTPNLVYENNIFLRTSFRYANITNKSRLAEALYGSNFSQKSIGISLLVGKRLDLYNRIYAVGGYSYIETPFYIPGINASDDRIDNLVEIGIGYEHDTRDLAQFPKKGIFSSVSYNLRGIGIDGISYSVGRIDFREYRRLFKNLISKWRFSTRVTIGENVPYYDYSIIGLDEKVRGHLSEKIEGKEFYFGSVELFYPIIEELNLDLSFLPIIPNQLLSYRIGFYTQIFAETALAKFKDQPYALNRFNSGYGIGLTLLVLPYQALRIEVAFNEKFESQLVLDLGISF